MANTGVRWQQAAHTTYHYLLSAQEEPHKKASLLTTDTEVFGEGRGGRGRVRRMDHTVAETNQTERATRPRRGTREEIAKGNQMTALRFQTGG